MPTTALFRSARPMMVAAGLALASTLLLGSAVAGRAAETAVAPEKNPPGDIPDDQVFITYNSPKGFTLKVPEGWARSERADGVSFADRYGRIDVAVTTASVPTPASVRSLDAPAIEAGGHAAKIETVKAVTLPAGPGVRITYTVNSEPNAVTGKQIRLETERTLLGRDGRVAALTFAAPAGADNVDQWKLMADSFRWK